MDILSNKKLNGKVEGEIYFNGKRLDNIYQRSIGYVEQCEILYSRCNVLDALEFSSKLGQPRDTSKGERYSIISVYTNSLLIYRKFYKFSNLKR